MIHVAYEAVHKAAATNVTFKLEVSWKYCPVHPYTPIHAHTLAFQVS